jgi:hypothetical protein
MSNTNNQNFLSLNKTKDTDSIQNKFPMKDLEKAASEMTFFVQSLFSKKIELVSEDWDNQELEILNSRNQEVKKTRIF